jgi:hypothetical protein
MARKKAEPKAYTVIRGCDTADGTRYEIGDVYDPSLHSAETTKALLEMEAINGDSQ